MMHHVRRDIGLCGTESGHASALFLGEVPIFDPMTAGLIKPCRWAGASVDHEFQADSGFQRGAGRV
jgi:hypothetical protein